MDRGAWQTIVHGVAGVGKNLADIMAAASARRETLLWLQCQPGGNKHLCSSYSSSPLLPASLPRVLPPLGSANSADSVNSKNNWSLKQDPRYRIEKVKQ